MVGPLPPPIHGVTVSTHLVLVNEKLRRHFKVVHINTSDHRSGENIGIWDTENVRSALHALARLVLVLARHRRGLLYLPLSQNRWGFFRDSLFIFLSALFRWRIATHLRGSDFPRFYRSRGPLFRWWVRRTMAEVTSCGVMGHSLRDVFADMVGADRVAVVPNGTPEPSLRAQPDQSNTVVFLSNLRRRKGVEPAVEAARLVLRSVPGARFAFVGPWENAAFELKMRKLAGGDTRIEFLPGVKGDDKDALLASAAALLFPPVEPEGHPRVVLEALAAGLPVVTTDKGAIAETVIDGATGYVLDEADPILLADRLTRLMRDPELRAAMGRAGRKRYQKLYTQDVADTTISRWLSGIYVDHQRSSRA